MSIDVTDSAKQQMKNLLSKNQDKYAVRLSVLGGGCAGFKYDWGFLDKAEEVEEGDIVVDLDPGKFVVDKLSVMFVLGTTVNYKEEVFGSHFELVNPNAKSSCGCGESFGA